MSQQSMPVVVTRNHDTPAGTIYRVTMLDGATISCTARELAQLGLSVPPVTITVELTHEEIDSYLEMYGPIPDPHDGWARARNKIRRALLGDRTETEFFQREEGVDEHLDDE